MEARRPFLTTEQKEVQREARLDFLLDADTGGVEQEFVSGRRTLAELLITNPAFKSEKAKRALHKLKETLKTADQNLPEELKNELRHERKDTQTLRPPVHIGAVVSDVPTRQPGLASMVTQQSEEENEDKQEESFEEQLPKARKSIYKLAMLGGFSAAVVIMILLSLIL